MDVKPTEPGAVQNFDRDHPTIRNGNNKLRLCRQEVLVQGGSIKWLSNEVSLLLAPESQLSWSLDLPPSDLLVGRCNDRGERVLGGEDRFDDWQSDE